MFKTLIAGAILLVATSVAHASEKIKIAELNWMTGSMLAYVDAYIIQHGYGYDVEVVPGGHEAATTAMIAKGDPNIVPEAWQSLLPAAYADAVASGKLETVNTEVISEAGEGFWVPSYFLTNYPEIDTFEKLLERPDLFPHPDDASKGAFYTCPSQWNCHIVNANLYKAFGMEAKGWLLVDPGSAPALDAVWTKKVAQGDNIVGYWYAPSTMPAKLDMVMIPTQAEFAGQDNWKCMTDKESTCDTYVASPYPASVTMVVTTKDVDPQIKSYLSKRKLTGAQANAMLMYGEENQAVAQEVAMEFLDRYSDVWQSWVPQSVAKKVTKSLE